MSQDTTFILGETGLLDDEFDDHPLTELEFRNRPISMDARDYTHDTYELSEYVNTEGNILIG